MPKRISDVSLHVYVTPETLDRIVADVRTAVHDHVQDRDVYAWRFTLPVDANDPVHHDLESQWRGDHPGLDPDSQSTYEIALSLVGAPDDLTDADIADLEHGLALAVYGATPPQPGHGVPFLLRAHQRTDVVAPQLDHELR
ncbi:hypothetical protein ACFWU5_12315 [Nocardia sp. NPDC058640]|uniref:hypothetical protein n=1 Tax=Nocardia sp. NPDC058640 TaxID=3346571 RepID=UPI003647EF38